MDGQKFSMQARHLFQTYSVSFSESWFIKPVSFSSSLSYSKQFLNNFITQRADKQGVLIS
jgi:outer membrane protein insertion porin family